MQLSKIKLAGFKTFVDPITIPFTSQLTSIVGPNGCGKSNIIDAVRWVMGESSAKTLRGDSMADVIFNGSSGRKPVGFASVELIFDNSDGALGGQYAGYAEISIKRVVSRDGTSNYYLNNLRCRRKDITDIFLGTGLGPRSYSIIEQGMISRLIEAKPDELRVFLEEAAGISKYKERRRETESRIRHTRENLERVEDLRGELAKQLDHLNRQARAAERYKELKTEERKVRAELLALRWRALDRALADRRAAIREKENAFEAALAEQRRDETGIEKKRDEHATANDAFNEVQARFYSVGSDIARVEQAIQHAREMRQKQRQDLGQAEAALQEIDEHIARDREQIETATRELAEIEPRLETLRGSEGAAATELAEAEGAMAEWQQRWEAFTQEAGEPARQAEVERTRLDHLEREQRQASERLERVRAELADVEPGNVARELEGLQRRVDETDARARELQGRLEANASTLAEMREVEKRAVDALDAARREEQQAAGRLASLEALQQAALGADDAAVTGWLEGQGLANVERLGTRLRVETGWERAVEAVLGDWVQAVCIDGLDPVMGALDALTGGAVTLLDRSGGAGDKPGPTGTLLEKVTGGEAVAGRLAAVRTAPDLAAAVALRDRLGAGDSVVTPDGIWLGSDWVRVVRDTDGEAGILSRGEAIRGLQEKAAALGEDCTRLAQELEARRSALDDTELEREQLQSDANRTHREHAEAVAELNGFKERSERLDQQRRVLAIEIGELDSTVTDRDAEIRAARKRLEDAVSRMAGSQREREGLESERAELRATVERARTAAREYHDEVHRLALLVESKRSSRDSLQQNQARMDNQRVQLKQRRDDLERTLSGDDKPMAERETELARLLQRRTTVEQELTEARKTLERIDGELRELEQQRTEHESRVADARDAVQQLKMDAQEQKVRAQALTEQLGETGHTLEALFTGLADDADPAEWEANLQKLEARINRLGPINLAAIDEFADLSERKNKLDEQYGDLMEALTTLENAIRKIDRETRTRFKETFDRVNSGLQAMFPKLFGGGHAYLELTGEDLLDTGVTLMARPPGKRNSTIHLLSGGEKALCAVALVFAIFELNPSPFCMLDEVDAPLDDANVARFCELVRDMSRRIQFVLITHNKLTMELAQQLTGVTMQEPGVSRLVAVDIDEAVQMAAM